MPATVRQRVIVVMQWLNGKMEGTEPYEDILKQFQKKITCIVGPVSTNNYRNPNPESLINTELLEAIVEIVMKHYGVERETLFGRHNYTELSRARQVLYFLCMTKARRSQMDCSRFLGRERTSLIYSRDSMQDKIARNTRLRATVYYLADKCEEQAIRLAKLSDKKIKLSA